MFKTKSLLLLYLLAYLLFFSISLNAAPQLKHHAIDINLTYGSHVRSEISIPWLNSIWFNENTGFSGKLGYDYFFSDNLALTTHLGVMYSREILTVSTNESSSITNLMVGMKYYPPIISNSSAVRIFLLGTAGMALGSDNVMNTSTQSSFSEYVFMGHVGGGCDFVLGSLIKLNIGVGYNYVDEFSKPLGSITDFSGIQTSLGIGFMF